ncbi:putative transcriptional regulatory protein C3C7.04 [Fusarium oxysporum f. sp. albedinis]|nr:putative transcriptional regulatory protein C3C7.04 [Fusarium oxysporum f. sp. albedinis]
MPRSLLFSNEAQRHGKAETVGNMGLVLSSGQLTDARIKGAIHGTEQGSDHRMIETVFDISVPAFKQDERLLFNNPPKDINNKIVDTVRDKLMRNRVQQKTNKLTLTVSEVA